MANLRLYKDFYTISYSHLTGETYTLIDPYALTATTNVEGITTIVETPSYVNESVGRYYVNLNPNYYSFDKTYEIQWHVYYVSYAPYKILRTRFRVSPNNITGAIEIEVLTPQFDIVVGNKNIDIQI